MKTETKLYELANRAYQYVETKVQLIRKQYVQ